MNYELALKLKETGFKISGVFGVSKSGLIFINDGEYGWCAHGEGDYENEDFDSIAPIPTLSELIEACGESITRQDKTYEFLLEVWRDRWVARFVDDSYHEIDFESCDGSTPEEAVAKLYIALYNKGNETENNKNR